MRSDSSICHESGAGKKTLPDRNAGEYHIKLSLALSAQRKTEFPHNIIAVISNNSIDKKGNDRYEYEACILYCVYTQEFMQYFVD